MGKWIDRLRREISAAPPYGGTAKTAKRGVLSVLAVGSEGGEREITRPATDRRADVLARLLRWGWPPELAAATADRVARREADDDRRTCVECRHYAPGRCRNHKRADLRSPDVGRDLAALPQRCGGFRRDV